MNLTTVSEADQMNGIRPQYQVRCPYCGEYFLYEIEITVFTGCPHCGGLCEVFHNVTHVTLEKVK